MTKELFDLSLEDLYKAYRDAIADYYLDPKLGVAYFAMIDSIGRWRFGTDAWQEQQHKFFQTRAAVKRSPPTLEDLDL